MADNFVLLPAENDFSDRVRGGLGQDLQTELAGSGLVVLEGIPSDFEAQLQTVLDEGATLITNFERHDQTPAQPESESHSDLQSSAQSSNSLELQGEGVVDMHATPANSSVAVTAETKADQILTKAGYDYIFHDSELASEYNCAICLSVARNPQQTKCCGTTFCHYCIMRALTSSKVGCSICNKEDVELIPDKAQRQKINKLKVQCPIVGCAWIVELADIEAHKKKPHPLSPPLTSPHSTLQHQQRKKQQQLDQFLTSSEQQQQQQSEEPVISVRQKPPIPTPRKLSNVPQLRPENDDALPDYVNTTVILPVTDQSLQEHLPDYVNTTVIRPVTDQSLREHLPDYVNTTVIRPVTDREQPAKLTDEMPEYLNLTLPRPRVPRNQKASKRSQSSPPSPKRLKMAHYVNLNQSSSHSPSPPLLPELNQLVPLQNQMQPFTDQPQVQSPSQSPLLHDEMAIYENVTLPTPPLDEFGLPPFQSDPNLVPEVPTTTEGVPDYLNITLPRVRPRVPSNTNVHEGSQTPPSSPNRHSTFQYVNLEQPSPSQSPPLPPDLVPLLSLLDEPMSLQNQMQPFSDQLTNQPSNFPLSPSPPPDLPPPLISLPPPLLSLIQPLPEQPPQQNQSQPLINTATYENITQSPPLQGTNELYVDVSLLQETPKLTFPWANQPECIDMFQPQRANQLQPEYADMFQPQGANQLQPEYADMFQPQGANQLQPEYADMFQPQGNISRSQGAMEYASVSQPQGANESDMSQTQGPEYIDMSRPQGANQEYASVFQPQRANQPEYVDMSQTQGANQPEYVDMSRPQGAKQEYASVSQPQRAKESDYVDMSQTQGANQPEYVDMSRPQGANQEYASVSQPQRANQPEYVDMSRPQGANQEYASVSQPQRANESDYVDMSQTQGANQPEYVDMSRPQGANQEYASVSQPQRANESDYADMSQTQGANQPEYVDMSRPQGANQEYASVSQPQGVNESGVSQPHQEASADALPRQLPTPPVVQNQSATIPQSEAAAAAAAANYATIVSNTDTTDHIYEPLLPPCSPPPEEPDPEPAMYANLPIPLPPPPPPLPPRDPPAAQPTQEPPPPLPPRTPTPTSEQPVQPEEEQPPPLPAHNERALSLPLDATPQPHEAENQPQPVLEGGHSQIELQQGNADDIAESAPPRYDDLSQTPLQPAPNQDVLIILNRHVDNTPPTQGGDGPLRTENIDIRYELGDVHQENKRKRKTKIIL